MATIYALYQMDENEDTDSLLGVFSTEQHALLWSRRYRLATGDMRAAIPVRHGGALQIGARFWIIPMELDPKPITREQWLADVSGATAMTGSDDR